MTLRTLLALLIGVNLGCAPESAGPVEALPAGDIRAIHITRDGARVDSIIRTGTLGLLTFGVEVEARDGTLRPLGVVRAAWGSTQPSIVDPRVNANGEMFVFRHQNGHARIVAEVGRFRDSVTIAIMQVATTVQFKPDTFVTLTPAARDVTGDPTAYHTFRFGAERLDSNEFPVGTAARIDYAVVGDAPFDLFSDARGDTLSIAGRVVGSGSFVARVSGITDTLPVQVADAYRVLRLTTGPDGMPRALPLSVTIPRGTAIVFRNETRFPEELVELNRWRVGPIPPGGSEAQLFGTPGVFDVRWAGQFSTITVTP